jgi:hypothetical protein
LGAYVSPSGNSAGAKKELWNKAMAFTQLIHSSTQSRQDAYWAYLLYFIPQVGFSLPVTSLSHDDCSFI